MAADTLVPMEALLIDHLPDGKEWKPLLPKLVVEVSFDHVTEDRFRHGTTLLRFRPDKAPRQCTMDQLRP